MCSAAGPGRAGPVLVRARGNHKGKNLSPAAFRGTVSNQIYALTSLKGKKSPPFAKRVSCHHVMSALGLLKGRRRKASAKKQTLLVTFASVIRSVSQRKRPGRANASPLGQAHPPRLLARPDNPHRVQPECFTLHIYALHIFTSAVNSTLTRLLLLSQVRRTCLSVFG